MPHHYYQFNIATLLFKHIRRRCENTLCRRVEDATVTITRRHDTRYVTDKHVNIATKILRQIVVKDYHEAARAHAYLSTYNTPLYR